MSSTAREVRAGLTANGGEAASLVESAMLLRWRAPELALLLADRAVSAAQEDKMAVLRADHLAVFTLNRLGRHAEAAHRFFPAIRDAETPQGLRHELHVELAHCAAALGEPATALRAAQPVLAAGDDVAPALRGGALVAVAEASIALVCDDLVTSALEEADELYREDPSLDHDTALLLRAATRATDAARHRARGALDKAEAKAREGHELLAGLADPDHDSGEVSARLMLELAFMLLDRGAGEAAMREVRPLLRRPVRAAAAAAMGRLRLAVATRVHLAEGRHEPALTLLADAVEGAQRYGMDAVLAECLEGLSHVHEARDEFADALHCMRAARAAEGRHLRAVAAARSTLLENCGSARREEARLIGEVVALLGNAGAGSTGLDPETGPLNAEIMVEAPANPTAEGETRVAGLVEAPEVQPADSVLGDLGLADADVAEREGVGEPAVADVAQVNVVAPPATPVVGDVAQSERTQSVAAELTPPVVNVSLVGLTATSTEPIDPLTEIQTGIDTPLVASLDAKSSAGQETWQSRARHRSGGAGTLVSVSELLPPSALSVGRSGRRRAEEPADDREDEASTAEACQINDDGPEGDSASGLPAALDPAESAVSALTYPVSVQLPPGSSATVNGDGAGSTPAEGTESLPAIRREFPASGPPPAPTPRTLDWGSGDEDAAEEDETHRMGLGQLLAEALAAYQESRDVHPDALPTKASRSDDPPAADADTGRNLPRYRGRATRWTAGLTLASNPSDSNSTDPNSADHEEVSEAITNPLLRLPDLTAEPQWAPPETGRRSAAGD